MIDRLLVTMESPTAQRNGAGFHPCQGLYYTQAGDRPTTAIIATAPVIGAKKMKSLMR